VGTPPAIDTPPRFSEHLERIPHEGESPVTARPTSSVLAPPSADFNENFRPRVHSGSSALSPTSGATRASFLTTDTGVSSRYSALEHFPTPPALLVPADATPAHMNILRDYFGTPSPAREADDPLARAGAGSLMRNGAFTVPEERGLGPSLSVQERARRRTTFGQDEFSDDDV
jgi:hypothetical protein